jgi:hypothetical protein
MRSSTAILAVGLGGLLFATGRIHRGEPAEKLLINQAKRPFAPQAKMPLAQMYTQGRCNARRTESVSVPVTRIE